MTDRYPRVSEMEGLAMAKRLMLAAAVLLIGVAGGCSRLNQENYDQLEVGMPYSEVVELLGEADDCSSALGMKNCLWGSDEKYIQVHFMADKVVLFSASGL